MGLTLELSVPIPVCASYRISRTGICRSLPPTHQMPPETLAASDSDWIKQNILFI